MRSLSCSRGGKDLFCCRAQLFQLFHLIDGRAAVGKVHQYVIACKWTRRHDMQQSSARRLTLQGNGKRGRHCTAPREKETHFVSGLREDQTLAGKVSLNTTMQQRPCALPADACEIVVQLPGTGALLFGGCAVLRGDPRVHLLLQHIHRQRAGVDHDIVECAQVKLLPQRFLRLVSQSKNL